jgi:hypothetical protein
MSEVTQENNNLEENPLINKTVLPEGPLKAMLVNYVGDKLKPENDQVTVHMLVSVMAEEFPEFVLLVAEENFLRGYQQAFDDIEKFNQLQNNNKEETKSEE